MSLGGMSVLLAEDNPTNQMVATHMLESLGAEVTLAQDGAEALEALDGQSFDVALIDIEMPRVSGLDVIRRMRSRPCQAASMPMIALTAYVMREHRAAIEDAGADGIISKPIVSIDRFGAEILALVRSRVVWPPEDPAADEPEFDPAVLDALCDSFAPAARRELASRIARDIAAGCEAVAAAIRAREFMALATATHPLISIAGTIGARRLETLARRLNSAGHAGDDADIESDGSHLLLQAERVLTFVCSHREDADA